MSDLLDINCPYCGECFAVQASGAGGRVDMIEDCMVCCRPVRVLADFEGGELARLEVERS